MQAEYDATGRFLWKRELQPLAVGMKKASGAEWLADLSAHAVLDTVARLDGALRKMVKDRNAARNVYRHGQEGRNRASDGATGGEIGVHDGACSVRVPVGEPPMFAGVGSC